MAQIRFEEDFVFVSLPKCLLVFTRDRWLRALKRGKLVKRQAREEKRPAKEVKK